MKKGRTFVVGDIHGGYRALIQVLEGSNFDYKNDTLICLGDLADGWSETHLVIEELKKVKNLILIKGNHDDWAMVALITDMVKGKNHLGKFTDIEIPNHLMKYNKPQFFMMKGEGRIWYQHGGLGTEFSYKNNPHLIIDHVDFLDKAVDYHIDGENRFYAHSGPDPFASVEDSNPRRFYWNREFWSYTTSDKLDHKEFRNHLKRFSEIYIGHTPTNYVEGIKDKDGNLIDTSLPVNVQNVWNMDTGSCFSGRLSMMDIDTKEVFQSDRVKTLYPNERGRLMMCYNDELEQGLEEENPKEIKTPVGVWRFKPKK